MTKKAAFNFDFKVGQILCKKYKVLQKIGSGWEGEVYRVEEVSTGIERAAKFFYPKRNIKNSALIRYAKKLHKLRHCPMVIGYQTKEMIRWNGVDASFLVSEYVEGKVLSAFIKSLPKKRLDTFPALHLLHKLASGIELIHAQREYHGDLHSDNVIISRFGLGFNVRVLDMYDWGPTSRQNQLDDVADLVKMFYEYIGGEKIYKKLPPNVRYIIGGRKKNIILKRFRSAAQLKMYIENMEWE